MSSLDDAFARALDALRAAGVRFEVRKPPGAELDLYVPRLRARRANAALSAIGFHRLRARGQGAHRFYLAHAEGRWAKVDVKTSKRRGSSARAARWMPPSLRRSGPVVAILGSDGAGKGTVIDALIGRIPVAAERVYLGTGASGGQRRDRPQRSSPNVVRECAFVARKAVRAWRALARGYAHAWRGAIVLCDRHPLEILAIEPARSPRAAALERLLATRLTPAPDAIVVLDAPPEVLRARKPEWPLDTLARWRDGYARAFVGRASIVDAARAPEVVADEVSTIVWDALARRRNWVRR